MEQEPVDVERRAVLRWGLCGSVAVLAVAAGCSSSDGSSTASVGDEPSTEAATSRGASTTVTTATTSAAGPVPVSLQPPATADQLGAAALIYHAPDGDNHLGSFIPTPDGKRPTLVGLGDSVLACAFGQGTKSVDPKTGTAPGPRTGLARWHDGKDPTFHGPLRPSTSETARFGGAEADGMNSWLPATRELVRGLPVDGVLVQGSHSLYGSVAASTQAKGDEHLAQLGAFVADAAAKAGERGRFSLTILFPPLVLDPRKPANFATSLSSSEAVLSRLRSLRAEGVEDGLRFHVDTAWWDVIRPLLETEDVDRLLELHDPEDRQAIFLEHPANDQQGGILYGDVVVAAYEAMGAFARTGR